ncbi:MAG: hypothetical protein O2862_09555 [Bacteroidetes bacterium]|nr:hypothetical protein [Bacteroidota bacterium]
MTVTYIQPPMVHLEEGDMDDKKARINKKVIPDVYKNVLLACALTEQFTRAEGHYNATLRLDFSRGDENDLKARHEM